MLYKKVHRQHLRQWRKGRRFKFKNGGGVRVISKLFIGKGYIYIDYDAGYINPLISMEGQILSTIKNIEWLE